MWLVWYTNYKSKQVTFDLIFVSRTKFWANCYVYFVDIILYNSVIISIGEMYRQRTKTISKTLCNLQQSHSNVHNSNHVSIVLKRL